MKKLGHEGAQTITVCPSNQIDQEDEPEIPGPKPFYTRQPKPSTEIQIGIMICRARSVSPKQERPLSDQGLKVPRSNSLPNLNDRSAYNRCIGQTVLAHESEKGNVKAAKRIEEFESLLNGL